MSSIFEPNQANGRYILVQSARLAEMDGHSMQEWIDNEEVQQTCKKYDLALSLLDHIAWWVWKNPKRR